VARYRSRIDPWLLAVIGVPALALPVLAVMSAADGSWARTVFFAVVASLLAWILAGTSYEVTDDALVVRSAFLRWTVPLASVRSLRATHNPLSAPALSLDRIEVRHDRGYLLVSPREKSAFVREIAARAPGLRIEGLPGPGAPAGDGGSAPSAEPGRSGAAIWIAYAIVNVLIVGLVGSCLYRDAQPPEVVLEADGLTVGGFPWRQQLPRSAITGVEMVDALPATKRRVAGSAFGRTRRGLFALADGSRVRLFVDAGAPPYVLIKTTREPVYVNHRDAASTRRLHAHLTEWFHGR
jgi:hypothetical protein